MFAGTPAFAVPALDALHAAGHEITAVFTQPDRPAGRGQKLTASDVSKRAAELGIRLFKPLKFDAQAQAQLQSLAPEVMVVVAYGLILPRAVLEIPAAGCINIHASLLPRWRGAAPVARAVEAGDSETGITIMRMDAGLDTGPMLLWRPLPIAVDTTAAQLQQDLARLGGKMIVETLARLNELPEQPQPSDGSSYAKKLTKEEARIDWRQPAATIARRIRAFNPAPVAWSELDGERIRLWNARALQLTLSDPPGTIVATDARGIHVASGDGVVVVTEIQRPGGRQISAAHTVQTWNPSGRCFA